MLAMSIFGRRRTRMPEAWRQIAEQHVTAWNQHTPQQQQSWGELMADLLDGPRWEAARDFELTDRIRVVIAAQATRLLLGLDATEDWYGHVTTVVVHRSVLRFNHTSRDVATGVENCGVVHLDGQTSYRGPVVISWAAASRAARHPRRGRDVVMHEFAHVIDMLDGVVDGTPPLPQGLHDRWVEVCTDVFERMEETGSDLIDDYATTDAGEFFAVATETFFTLPVELRTTEPDLYGVLRDFFNQDPAAAFPA